MKIAIVDPASFSLPYDYFYIQEVSKYYTIDFYYSQTKYNDDFIAKLKSNKNVNLFAYNISSSVVPKIIGLKNYIKMLREVFQQHRYKKIHFIWNLYLPLEQFFFKKYGDKFIFTFHNNVPHNFKGNRFKPYQKINQLAQTKVFLSQFVQQKFLYHYDNVGDYYLAEHGIIPIEKPEKLSTNDKPVNDSIYFWGRVEDYKGVDIFANKLNNYNIKIYGKWNKNLYKLRDKLKNKNNITIVDSYISLQTVSTILGENNIFILPYKNSTQSGIFYTLLANNTVFISSNNGETALFLQKYDLPQLIFNRHDEMSIVRSFEYAVHNYAAIKKKLSLVKEKYKWHNVLTKNLIKKIYE